MNSKWKALATGARARGGMGLALGHMEIPKAMVSAGASDKEVRAEFPYKEDACVIVQMP